MTCCGIPGAPGLANPGIDLRIGQSVPQAFNWSRALPNWLVDRLALTGATIALNSVSVDVRGVRQQADLSVTARPGAIVGNWIIWVGAEDTNGRVMSSIPLTVNVLPPWPAAGPSPRCASTLNILDLSAIEPMPYVAKTRMPSLTSFPIAAKVPRAQVGLQFTIRSAGVNPPLAPNQAGVKLINSQGRAVGIRNSNSNDCAIVNSTLMAEAGGVPAALGISTADTTTLVFSKSTCRFWFIGCWSWGLDDVVQLSEGALWTLFGGREVEIETVGDWSNELQWGDWVIGGVF